MHSSSMLIFVQMWFILAGIVGVVFGAIAADNRSIPWNVTFKIWTFLLVTYLSVPIVIVALSKLI